jgi:hypothetical protein
MFFDEEAGNWHYRVPALHINGGVTPTREDAERDCRLAIAFVLDGAPHDYDTDAETLTFDVNVEPAARVTRLHLSFPRRLSGQQVRHRTQALAAAT